MEPTQLGHAGSDYQIYDDCRRQNENFHILRNPTSNHPQFGHGGYCYPHLQNQNLFVSAENYHPQGHRMYDSNLGHGGFYYAHLQNQNYPPQGHRMYDHNLGHEGFYYPHLQNQNLFVSSQNYHPQGHRMYDHNQFSHYGLHNHGEHQFPHGNYYPEENHIQLGHDNLNRHQSLSQQTVENQNMVLSDRHETNSTLIEYQLLSSPSVPSEVEGNTDRQYLINYLKYLQEKPECDINDGVNDVSISSDCTDVNLNEHENDGVNDVSISSDCTEVNVNEHENDGVNEVTIRTDGTDIDVNEHENEKNVLVKSVTIQPKVKIGCDNSNMFVKTSDSKSPKKLCCPFCDKLYQKLARHLEDKHKTEPDVQKILSFPKGSKQRRLIQDSLRKTGLINWNKNAAINKSEMITSRRPNPKFANDGPRFKVCPYCYGFYTKLSLRLHIRYKCELKPIDINEKTKVERVITALSTSIEARYHENASKALQNVYKRFRDNALVRSLKFDWLITVYGNKLSAKYNKIKSPDMIRNRLRVIARFLRELKRIEPEVADLATLYHPKYFDRTVEAIQAVARFDEDNSEFGAPATASSCVTAIKQVGAMLIAEYIKRDDQEKQRLTQNFLTVMNIDIHNMINKTVNENQSKMRRRKVIILPSLEDLKLLNQYIQSKSNDCYNELLKKFNYTKWLDLSKLTMISILVFNRKRVGDTENILLEDFECKEAMNENTNEQLFASLSNEAKEVARRYSRMKVRGKKNRTVPLLLNESMEKSLNLLISHRTDAGILPKNQYLFALPPSSIEDIRVINGGLTLKKFVKDSGTKNPSSFTATNLRKQLATMCVSFKLDDAEVADVAEFMGHAELVHRNSYRQNTIDRQVVKMSQWLEAALGNAVSIDDTERKSDNENRQKAINLLQLLQAALGAEKSSDDKNDVRPAAAQKRKNSSDVTMKSKRRPAAAQKRKNSSDVTMKSKRRPAAAQKRENSSDLTIKSKRVCVRNRKSVN